MSEKSRLIESMVETISDYRKGACGPPTPGHVEKWLRQFDKEAQLPILREMDHVLKRTYFSERRVKRFLESVYRAEKLVGDEPCSFWKNVKFLDIQRGGNSQKDMLALFNEILSKECGFSVNSCGKNPHSFVYLDDALFTGNRIKQDLEPWVTDHMADNATIHVITIALHTRGYCYASKNIRRVAKDAGKRVKLRWWRKIKFEDRISHTDSPDVLRPTSTYDDHLIVKYIDTLKQYIPQPRTAGKPSRNKIFSSEYGRQILEKEFLMKGAWIREKCLNLKPFHRPLGNSVLETLGFGSLVVTFRNCPNSAPLALWANDPWYPLFHRMTNAEASYRCMV